MSLLWSEGSFRSLWSRSHTRRVSSGTVADCASCPTACQLSRQLLLLQMCIVVARRDGGRRSLAGPDPRRPSATTRAAGCSVPAESLATEGLIRQSRAGTEGETPGETRSRSVQESVGIRLERRPGRPPAPTYAVLQRRGRALGRPSHGAGVALPTVAVEGASWRGSTSATVDGRSRRRCRCSATPSGEHGRLDDRWGTSSSAGSTRPASRSWVRRRRVSSLYLALAGRHRCGRSLLLARRVKRQTLGLEPREIAALVEQREAMLHGVREGVARRRPGGGGGLRQRRGDGAARARAAGARPAVRGAGPAGGGGRDPARRALTSRTSSWRSAPGCSS